MSWAELETLAEIGKLKRERPSARKLERLYKSAVVRLADAAHPELSYYGRFDCTYSAALALALCALRRHGYRSEDDYLVFQTLEHTVGLRPETVLVLARAHQHRDAAESRGVLDKDERLMAELMDAAKQLRAIIEALPLARD